VRCCQQRASVHAKLADKSTTPYVAQQNPCRVVVPLVSCALRQVLDAVRFAATGALSTTLQEELRAVAAAGGEGEQDGRRPERAHGPEQQLPPSLPSQCARFRGRASPENVSSKGKHEE
jgi:hypothetical protein